MVIARSPSLHSSFLLIEEEAAQVELRDTTPRPSPPPRSLLSLLYYAAMVIFLASYAAFYCGVRHSMLIIYSHRHHRGCLLLVALLYDVI